MLKTLSKSLILLTYLFILGYSQTENDRPIIGVVTTPSDYPNSYNPSQYSYFRASYPKWVESGGCRVTPIPWNLAQANLLKLLAQLNGVVFSSGFTDIIGSNLQTSYLTVITTIVNYVIEQNNQGTYYPLLGIDQGFLALVYAISSNSSLFQTFDVQNTLNNIQLTSFAYSSKMFSSYPEYIFDYVQNNDAFWFNQTLGISPTIWNDNSNLTSFFNLLGITTDSSGDSFVSAAEGKTLPFYGIQFHPEKSAFDWDSETYNHDYNAIEASQLIINRFIDDSRNNPNVFPTPAIEDTCLIYKWNTTILPDVFTQMYFFASNAVFCMSSSSAQTDSLSIPKINIWEEIEEWQEDM